MKLYIYIYNYHNAQTAFTYFNDFILANFENCFLKQNVKNPSEWINPNFNNYISRREILLEKKNRRER